MYFSTDLLFDQLSKQLQVVKQLGLLLHHVLAFGDRCCLLLLIEY